MDAATIQAKIYAGYAKAAQRVGFQFDVYRPNGIANPLASGNKLTTINASFTPGQKGFPFDRAPAHKDTLFGGLYDGTQTQVGDYLTATPGQGGQGTYFVAFMPSLQPILTVFCNRTINVLSPGPSQTFGAQTAYQGSTPANQAPVMTAWPASLLFEARGRADQVGLPLDLRAPYFTILMPALSGVDVRAGMIVTDDEDRQYVVEAAELSPFGWRITAQQAAT